MDQNSWKKRFVLKRGAMAHSLDFKAMRKATYFEGVFYACKIVFYSSLRNVAFLFPAKISWKSYC